MAEPTLEAIIEFLLETPMFSDLSPDELADVVHVMQVQRLRAGQAFFREGDVGDAWFVVYRGVVEVAKGGAVVAELGERACFGEMAVLDEAPRSATVRAATDVLALRIPRGAFQGLLLGGNLAAYKLVHQIGLVLVARQRATTQRLVELVQQQRANALTAELESLLNEPLSSE